MEKKYLNSECWTLKACTVNNGDTDYADVKDKCKIERFNITDQIKKKKNDLI
mgnify:CR=1 FL=1